MINKILYNSVGLGGTFDHFHDGHKSFIRYAASFARELTIGVTTKKMTLSKPFNKTIEHTTIRSKAVKNFCAQERINAKIIELNDIFGPTIEQKTVQAIACTTDTASGADKINEVRSKMSMRELPIHVHKLLLDKEKLDPINSSRIRTGEIDREGNVFAKILDKDLILNESQKNYFTKSQGKFVTQPSTPNYFTCVVGDSTLEQFVLHNWKYDLGIFDGKRERIVVNSEILNMLKIDQKVISPPGRISEELSLTLKKWVGRDDFKHIFVYGEEDLAAVALILLLPLGSNIYYGQPNQGIIEMKVTEGLKHNVFDILYN
ncbi:pantetheine-phosphate adenylyltransferase [Patescibacteria group bacterium]|nr:pantetheine-phosphate adenylyltransferase [Patescibacteria group bacterium]